MYQMSREKRLEERIRGMKPKDKVAELWAEIRDMGEQSVIVENKLADLEDICHDVVAGDETAMKELRMIMKEKDAQ